MLALVELSVSKHLLVPAGSDSAYVYHDVSPARGVEGLLITHFTHNDVCQYIGPDVAVGTLSAGLSKKNTFIRAGTPVRVCQNQYTQIPDADALVRVHAALVCASPEHGPPVEPARCVCEHMRIATKAHENCVCM